MPGSSRDALIEIAARLFYEHGFHAVGIDRIISEVGVTKTTFYNHFESKDDLIVEVLKWRDEIEMRELIDAMRQRAGSEPRALLLAIFDVLDEWFRDEGFKGCIFVNAAVEFPSPHDPVHHAAAAHRANVRREILSILRRTGSADPEGLADQITMLVSGALITRHVAFDLDAARTARATAEALLDRALAPSAA